ncbi:MAG: hypothetical protein EXS30_09700 [Pedosphaera sp.]|nr:hypothetical protein [Pedosphaera sp.]
MPSLQEWIHKMEVGEGTRYIMVVAAVLGLLALTALYDIREFKNFSTEEAMDSAQLARNIAEGRGYTTQFIRPLSVLLLQRGATPGIPVLQKDHPDLANPPAYPVILAGLMKLLPIQYSMKSPFRTYQPEMLIALLNQLFFFAAVLMVFRLALRLFDSGVAWVSAIVFAGTDLLWRFSVSGLSTMFLLCLVLVMMWCLVVIEQNSREGTRGTLWFVMMGIAVGVLAGLGALTRYSCGWLIFPVLGFVLWIAGARRWLVGSAVGVTFLLVVSPWLARNFALSGTLFGTAGFSVYAETEVFPENRIERYLNGDLDNEIEVAGAGAIFRKLMSGTADLLKRDLPQLGGTWLAAFFLVSLIVPFRNPALVRLRVLFVGCLAVLSIAQVLGRTHLSSASPEVNSENLLLLVLPVAVILGVGLFFLLLDQIEFSFAPFRVAVVLGFVSVVCAPFALTFLPPRSSPIPWPPYYPPWIQDVGGWFSRDEMLMSDMPWAVAWYGDRKCIWLTLDAPSDNHRKSAADFFSIYDYQKPISGLYLTTLTSNEAIYAAALKSPKVAWGEFMQTSLIKKSMPSGFPLKYANSRFMEEGQQLLLADRVRWNLRSK